MSFSTKKIRTLVLSALVGVWAVSVVSLGFASNTSPQCDPECPLELTTKSEIAYKDIRKKVVMLSGIVGWLTQYTPDK